MSSGLGHVRRGFEISCLRWYRALKAHTRLEPYLIAGSCSEGALLVPTIKRGDPICKLLFKLPLLSEKTRWQLTYGIEQISFLPGLVYRLYQIRPDVVWIKDVPLAYLVLFVSKLPGLGCKVVFANGGVFKPASYACFDRIQQLHPEAYDQAIEFGISREKMDLLSNCIDCESIAAAIDDQFYLGIRKSLGIAIDDYMIVSSAAWNRYHKRIDYLIEEVAQLGDPTVKLVLCGVEEADTDSLKAL
ncbi:MAG: hypothetical protein K8F91_22480, partial [Candidatus Obscuribacterales bacterium]|nr:hypothetical protein [Candidatus Obscuribacterales bacterium]